MVHPRSLRRRSRMGEEEQVPAAGEERYFEVREIMEAVAWAKAGGIAVHQNLDYSGTVIGGRARSGPFLHVFGKREALLAWGVTHGMNGRWIQREDGIFPPHFDVFGGPARKLLAQLGTRRVRTI
jgi:hypothetical protein